MKTERVLVLLMRLQIFRLKTTTLMSKSVRIFMTSLMCVSQLIGSQSAASQAVPPSEAYFFCDFLGSPSRQNQKGTPNSYFDRIFYYKKQADGTYAENFHNPANQSEEKFQKAQIKDGVLYNAFVTFRGKNQVSYRESFVVFRFDLQSKKMIRSHVLYLTALDDERNFGKPEYKNQDYLFSLVTFPVPKGLFPIGWDKSLYQCEDISYWKYLVWKVRLFFFAIMSA